MEQTFYSHGKLLLTAEYLVLDGAKALALPSKMGQFLHVKTIPKPQIIWTSFDVDNSVWFQDILPFEAIINSQADANSEPSIKQTLLAILHEAYKLNPLFLSEKNGYEVQTTLTFSRHWGLGTSSTLINNIAQWTQTNAYLLLQNSFGGSGYDIACAKHKQPIVYELQHGNPKVTPVFFRPHFTANIYFLYLNQKQSSKTAIANYRKKQHDLDDEVPKINQITQSLLEANDLNLFANLLEKHENLMSTILEIQTVKEYLFADFDGVVKSLGAWGGDFVMVVCRQNPAAYFKAKGYPVLIPYDNMIL
ncbi:GYDIA family GHMP kinase [Flavobacterium branchiophilum]|uniref:GHMP kinase n=1 Tax=Flavobacterium branchiophilum (strain FL-15) TaxID=1034807 RepID=G2Z548_FLABF|nr:GYDIA family GHMP kinase [Flavobacterium branchiophilum]CCB68554.1 Protein of unknown function [Flavobacterium branchiophilum FL-15]